MKARCGHERAVGHHCDKKKCYNSIHKCRNAANHVQEDKR